MSTLTYSRGVWFVKPAMSGPKTTSMVSRAMTRGSPNRRPGVLGPSSGWDGRERTSRAEEVSVGPGRGPPA
jgi:hypothetical protein